MPTSFVLLRSWASLLTLIVNFIVSKNLIPFIVNLLFSSNHWALHIPTYPFGTISPVTSKSNHPWHEYINTCQTHVGQWRENERSAIDSGSMWSSKKCIAEACEEARIVGSWSFCWSLKENLKTITATLILTWGTVPTNIDSNYNPWSSYMAHDHWLKQ